MRDFNSETVTAVRHWTDDLFSFRVTRRGNLPFQAGQFVMLGLPGGPEMVTRAYSISSAPDDDSLEFFSIVVPDGPLTSRLRRIAPGDEVMVGSKATGTLVLDHLIPGRTLYLLATGTGFAPFASLLRDGEVFRQFDRIVIIYGCRWVMELGFADEVVGEIIAEGSGAKRSQMLYLPTVTREAYPLQYRVTALMGSDTFLYRHGLRELDAATDRVMICGNPDMTGELRNFCAARGLREGSARQPGEFVIEKAFVAEA